MKPRQICYAKESAHPSGGAGARPGPTGPPWRPIASAPLGMQIRVRSEDGTTAVGVRDSHHPYWLDEARAAALPFVPAEWLPL